MVAEEEIVYECEICGKNVKVLNGAIPECCDRPMKQKMIQNSAPICIQASHSENARPMNDEEACDDGRAG